MTASYPGSIVSYTNKVTGDIVQALHVNSLQDEVVAIETALGTNFTYSDYTKTASLPVPKLADGRLTLTTATPVTTADVTNAATVYYTPYIGDQIALYSGSAWSLKTFTEKSLALAATTDGCYDVFGYSDTDSVLALEKLAWTNTTTRATALAYQNGVLVKNGDATRRYLGTLYLHGTAQVDDTLTRRGVWNYYNRVIRPFHVTETTVHTYNGVERLWNNSSTNNSLVLVCGVSEDSIHYSNYSQILTAAASYAITRIKIDGAYFNSLTQSGQIWNGNANYIAASSAGDASLSVGYHIIQAYEVSNHNSSSFAQMIMNLSFRM